MGPGSAGPATAVSDRVEERELYDETYEAFLSYAMSVIVDRAIPDVRDGLKPVHRRILFAMHELGLTPAKPFKKCARVVGEVLGKFHPHGDTPVYEALVRLAQAHNMRAPLVDGHGNFGSVDGDPAAAMRYTECRLTALAGDALLRDLDAPGGDTVDMVETFDASQREPVVLPAAVPLLLLNGASGIAVGIASSVPPHNLGELVSALRALIADPAISTAALMQHVLGPDLPTGGELIVGPDLLQTYETGKGTLTIRGKATIEGGSGGPAAGAAAETKGRARRGSKAKGAAVEEGADGGGGGGKELIIITELPYQVCKADFVAQVAELVDKKTLEGAGDVRDESDRTGMRVVVEVRKGASAQALLAQLFACTRLESKLHLNCVALAGATPRPRQMGLKEMLQRFLDFRCEIITRRSTLARDAAAARLHLVQGFLAVLSEAGRLEAAVAEVRGAADGPAAREALVARHGLSEQQAEAMLALTLRRLTGLEAAKLQKEAEELQDTVSRLESLLGDRGQLLAAVAAEAEAVAAAHPSPRRTRLVAASEAGPAADSDPAPTGPSPPCLLLASRNGYLRRIADEALAAQHRGGRGRATIKLRAGDSLAAVAGAAERAPLLLLTPEGRAYQTTAAAVPAQSGPSTSGSSVANVLDLPESFPLAALLPLPAGLQALQAGKGKKEAASARGAAAAAEEEVEREADVAAEEEDVEEAGAAEAVPAAAGKPEPPGPSLVLATRRGVVKRVTLPERRITKAGLQFMKVSGGKPKDTRDGKAAKAPAGAYAPADALGWAALCAEPGDLVALVSAKGQCAVFPAASLRRAGRGAGGVRGIRLGSVRRPDDSLAALAVLPAALAGLVPVRGAGKGAASDGEEEVEAEEVGELEGAAAPGRPPAGPCLLLVTARGLGKRLPLAALQAGGRGAAGLKVIRLAQGAVPPATGAKAARAAKVAKSKAGLAAAAAAAASADGGPAATATGDAGDRVVGALLVGDGEEVVVATRAGVVLRLAVGTVPPVGRATKGVRLVALDEGDEVASVCAAPV